MNVKYVPIPFQLMHDVITKTYSEINENDLVKSFNIYISFKLMEKAVIQRIC